VNLNNIHVLVLALWNLLARDHIANVHNAVVITIISVVIKEDVLRVVV